MKNSQARTGHQRGMGGRKTDDDDTHERHTDVLSGAAVHTCTDFGTVQYIYMLTRLLTSLRAARLPRQPSRALLSATPFWHRTAAPSVAQPAMLLRPPAVTPAPPIAGASRQRSQKQSNKLRQKRMAHPRRSKRDAMARRGIKPQQPLPDWKWGIFARDEVAVYHGKRKMGQGKVLRVDHARSRVWVEGIKLREFATEESANDPDPSRCAA